MIEFITKMGIPDQYAGDVWLLIIFIVIGLILTMLVKKKNLGALIVSVYIAYAILSFAYFLPDSSNVMTMFFGALIFVCFMGSKRIMSFSVKGKSLNSWLQTMLLALLAVGMISSLSLGSFSEQELNDFFTPFSKKLLITPAAQLFWIATPFLFLAALKKRSR